MFSEINPNLPNRTIYAVRGRVICFTDSKLVEWMPRQKERTFPIWVVGGYAEGHGVTFVAELDGWLVFDRDSYVKLEQVGEFNRFEIDRAYFLPTVQPVTVGGSPVGSIEEGTQAEVGRDVGSGDSAPVTSLSEASSYVFDSSPQPSGYVFQTFTFSDGVTGTYRKAFDQNGVAPQVPPLGTAKNTVLLTWIPFDPTKEEFYFFARRGGTGEPGARSTLTFQRFDRFGNLIAQRDYWVAPMSNSVRIQDAWKSWKVSDFVLDPDGIGFSFLVPFSMSELMTRPDLVYFYPFS